MQQAVSTKTTTGRRVWNSHQAPCAFLAPVPRIHTKRTVDVASSRDCASRARVVCNSQGGVIDAPTVENITSWEKQFKEKKPPTYKVLLHNDNYNRREYVVKVILKVVKGMTVDDAVRTMQEAHETGVGLVILCPQDEAERYCEGLRLNGLTSSIEPGNDINFVIRHAIGSTI